MKFRFISIAFVLIAIALVAAGCTSPSTPAPAATPAPTPEVIVTTEVPTAVATAVPTTAANSLVPSPTDVVPDSQAVTVSVEKAGTYSMTIMTTFNGGKGLMSVARMDVRVTKPDGTVVTQGIDKPGMGAIVEIEGTKGADRTEVIMTMKSGSVYKVYDQLVPYKTRS